MAVAHVLRLGNRIIYSRIIATSSTIVEDAALDKILVHERMVALSHGIGPCNMVVRAKPCSIDISRSRVETFAIVLYPAHVANVEHLAMIEQAFGRQHLLLHDARATDAKVCGRGHTRPNNACR